MNLSISRHQIDHQKKIIRHRKRKGWMYKVVLRGRGMGEKNRFFRNSLWRSTISCLGGGKLAPDPNGMVFFFTPPF